MLASRRWGTGDLRADDAIRVRRSDIGRGLLLSLLSRLATVVVVALLLQVAPRLAGSGSGLLDTVAEDRAALLFFEGGSVAGTGCCPERAVS